MYRVRFILNGEEIFFLITAITVGIAFTHQIVRNFTTLQGHPAREVSQYRFTLVVLATTVLLTGNLLGTVLVNER